MNTYLSYMGYNRRNMSKNGNLPIQLNYIYEFARRLNMSSSSSASTT